MKKLILTLALALGLASIVSAQTYPVSGHVASDTAGSVAMIIKYIGTSLYRCHCGAQIGAGGAKAGEPQRYRCRSAGHVTRYADPMPELLGDDALGLDAE